MKINAWGSNHLDPKLGSAIESISEQSFPLVVEGVPEHQQAALNEELGIEIDFGFDIGEDHQVEPQVAEDTNSELIYLDSGRPLEKQTAVITEMAKRSEKKNLNNLLTEGLNGENIELLMNEVVGSNLDLVYSLLDDRQYEKSFRDAYRDLMEAKLEHQNQKWRKDHSRILDGIATLVESNYSDWEDLYQNSIHSAVELPEMQDRENYWIKKLRDLEEQDIEEVNLVIGANHAFPADNNFYAKMREEGYDVNVQALRDVDRDYSEAFLFQLHG